MVFVWQKDGRLRPPSGLRKQVPGPSASSAAYSLTMMAFSGRLIERPAFRALVADDAAETSASNASGATYAVLRPIA